MIAGDVGGRSALALRLLLAAVSNRLSTSAGVATGEEVRLMASLLASIPFLRYRIIG